MRLTVAVCTWNRCASLGRTLDEMTRLVVPPGVRWEVLVVNNRSTDATDDVIASFEGRLPVRRAWEPEPGLAHARNRAVAEAAGDYVLWTDDDILVDADWLAAYHRAFERWPGAGLFGGPIEPLFEGEPPAWLPRVLDEIGPVFGRQTLGDHPVALSPETLSAGPYGGNMAMRRAALQRFPFDPRLGVRHGEYAIGEETEVMRRLLAAGLEGWWTPEPRVRHRVPRASQTLAYVRRWMVGCGRSEARLWEDAAPPWYEPAWQYVRLVGHEVGFRLGRPFAPPEVWMRNLVCASQARGRILARRAQRRPPERP